MKKIAILSVSLIGALLVLAMVPAIPEANAGTNLVGITIDQYAAIIRATIWDKQQFPIAVCWENADANDAPYQAIVKQAVQDSWEASSAVKFTGWGNCDVSKAVRIQIDDSGPLVHVLGRNLLNYPHGMVLNFTFKNWSPSCASSEAQRKFCIYAIAVHEFGHALGLTHEQNRADSPCKGNDQGPDPDTFVTIYDPDSVMNYCNKNWNGDGHLSNFDKTAIATLYGPHA